MQDTYERIAKQVNEAIGSDITAVNVESIDTLGINTDDTLSPIENAAYWLALHLLSDE